MVGTPLSLDSVPREVLEHIACHAADFLGPPSGLIALICLNRYYHDHLSPAINFPLYARIFQAKFDIAAPLRRLGQQKLRPDVLTLELKRRCFYLKRLRAQVDARVSQTLNDEVLQDLLFHMYLMMLENDGKNERQLREYGKIESWLHVHWFNDNGSSCSFQNILAEKWPPNDMRSSVAMWLLWFFMKSEDDRYSSTSVMHILRIFALSAHQYHLSLYPWTDFLPHRPRSQLSTIMHYSQELHVEPLPLATPAILSFLTMVNTIAEDNAYPTSLNPSTFLHMKNSLEWECEWGRCTGNQTHQIGGLLSDSFRPGSIEGVWEGFFTYTDFTEYALLLAGAPPNILHKSMVVRHRQTWKLREHHLVDDDNVSSVGLDDGQSAPLSPGNCLESFFPPECQIKEDYDGAYVQEPERHCKLHYRRASPANDNRGPAASSVKDVIIIGEGHSAWGQFNLEGRVRPCDGFISLTKKYIDGDRGRWLYRGYLVGDINGILVGRWRDTFSPVEVPGYEGCFVMSRRR